MSNLAKILPIFVIIALVGLGVGGYYYWQYQKAQKEIQTIKTDPTTVQKAAQEEVKRLIDEVGKLIALPSGEEPTVATITDIDKLKDQPFFQNAKNGDKVLIYTQAKKAILYNPAAKKIIDVAPVNIGSPSAQQAVKIVLRNGTDTVGLANKLEPDVKKSLAQAQVITKENAGKKDYDKSLIVALNDGAKDQASKLAKDLGISTGNLPEGESKPKEGDILVIIGKDKI